MKKILLFIVVTVIVASCGPSSEEKTTMNRVKLLQNTGTSGIIPGMVYSSEDINYYVVKIDGCEYICGYSIAGNGGPVLTHKGNCKNH